MSGATGGAFQADLAHRLAVARGDQPADLVIKGGRVLSVFTGEFWGHLVVTLKPLLWPYTVGSLLGALVLGALAYPLALAFVTSRRRIHEMIHHHHHHD